MPSGRTHDRITLWLLPWIVGLSWLLSRSSTVALLVASSFLFSGLMFGPDLDIYSVQYQRWGFLRWIWRPYQSIIPHRSWLSHGCLIGTLIRIFYLSLILILGGIPLIVLIQLMWGFDWNWQQIADNIWQLGARDYLPEILAIVIGLELGSMSHSLSDWLGSAYKRQKRKVRKVKKRR
jgi:uncharacterized metal-binding protein